MRNSPNGHAWLLAPILVLATACGDVLDDVPPRPAAIADPVVADAAFPSLATVPARPQLTYSLEQRRQIAEGLVADRANARYAGDSLRQALDRPVQPDTASPLPAVVAVPPSATDPEGDLSLAFLEETLARDSDDGSLGDFLERLQQPPPAVAEIRPSLSEGPTDADGTNVQSDRPEPTGPATAATAFPVPETAPADASEPDEPRAAVDQVELPATPSGSPVGPLDPPASAVTWPPLPVALPERDDLAPDKASPAVEVAVAASSDRSPGDSDGAPLSAEEALPDAPVAVPVAAPPAAPTMPLSILFQADAPDLGGEEHDKLRRLARDVASGDTTIVVSGGGVRAGLAMERARRVAAALVDGGLLPERIAIEMGGESNIVVVYEADA